MKKLAIATYVLRALGFILVILCFVGQDWIAQTFPGLETTNPIFYTGIAVYMVGAIIYFGINKKERADRRRRQIEEAQERAFGGRKD
ncbi:MAG: hypothetical protein MJY87_10810 [Fibrobacter sp.]|nr:hypothetical protein [Fibrobacter sp.]